ncbi:MAG: hypothetical protein ACRDRV_12995 [Pseudonocardiaceae bacterium]
MLGRTNPDHPGVLSALHFPVGGARIRPCLEDFLHFLAHEFQIDVLPNAPAILAEGRERWRRRQIGTPGEPYNGVPVTLTVVKFAESC